MAHVSIVSAQADADIAQRIASIVRGRGGVVSLIRAEDALPPALSGSAFVVLLLSRHIPHERLMEMARLLDSKVVPAFIFLLDETRYPGAAGAHIASLRADEGGFMQWLARLLGRPLERPRAIPTLPPAFLGVLDTALEEARSEAAVRPPTRDIPDGYGEDEPVRGGGEQTPLPQPVPAPAPVPAPVPVPSPAPSVSTETPASPPASPPRPRLPPAPVRPITPPNFAPPISTPDSDSLDSGRSDSVEVIPTAAPDIAAPEPVEATPAAEQSDGTPTDEEASDPVAFSVYAPRELKPQLWQPLKVYAYRTSASGQVEADAEATLGSEFPDFRPAHAGSAVAIAEGALITAIPDVPGIQFNPSSASVAFYEQWHRLDFKLRAHGAPLDQAANGRIVFTVEGVIAAEVPLSLYITEQPSQRAPVLQPANPYRAVFCSYSHADTPIVERVERAIKLLGYDYLRDATRLRSGEDWNAALLRMIDQADIFQLFWSNKSAESRYVRQEWEYALARMQRQGIPSFIRPVYWQQPMPPPPSELGSLHFAFDDTLDDVPGSSS